MKINKSVRIFVTAIFLLQQILTMPIVGLAEVAPLTNQELDQQSQPAVSPQESTPSSSVETETQTDTTIDFMVEGDALLSAVTRTTSSNPSDETLEDADSQVPGQDLTAGQGTATQDLESLDGTQADQGANDQTAETDVNGNTSQEMHPYTAANDLTVDQNTGIVSVRISPF